MGYCIIHDAYNGNGLCKYCYPPSETSDSTATAAPPSAIDNRTYAAMVDRIAELEVERDRLAEVYKAARGLAHGYDWNKGNHAVLHRYRARLIVAVDNVKPLPDRAMVAAASAALQEGE